MATEIIPFGKYKDMPIGVLQADPAYQEYIANQSWLANKYPTINTLIVNQKGKPSKTPEHNKLQAKFLDLEFRQKFLIRQIEPGQMTYSWEAKDLAFEHNGWDVYFNFEAMEQADQKTFYIECKTSLGDDYPAVLRQIKKYNPKRSYPDIYRILLYQQFAAKGASEDQVKEIFKLSGIEAIQLEAYPSQLTLFNDTL